MSTGVARWWNGTQWIDLTQAGPVGPTGPQGPAGATGPAGAAGEPGAAGVSATNTAQLWTLSGDVAIRTGTTRFYPRYAGIIVGVWASLGVAGSSTTRVDVNRSGTTIFTTQGNRPALTSGSHDASGTPTITTFSSTDYFTVDVDEVGTGASGLTVELLYTLTT